MLNKRDPRVIIIKDGARRQGATGLCRAGNLTPPTTTTPQTEAPRATGNDPARAFPSLPQTLIIAAAVIIIALGWFGAYAAIVAHRAASLARIESEVRSKDDLVAEQLRRELLVTDQSLHIVELEWERDPAHFDFDNWRRRVFALSDMSLQIFIADSHGIVRWSSRPEILGDNVSNRDYFRHAATERADDGRMFIGSLTRGLVTRQWQINLERRLDHPDGSFGGVIAASYDASAFARLKQEVDLGARGLLVVAAPNGEIHGLGDPALAETSTSLAGTAVFGAMRAARTGVWTGRSPLDGIDRILAFTTIPGRDLDVLVGEDRADAMRPVIAWEEQALIFTGAATVLLLLMAGILLWAERTARLRHAAIIRDRAVLTSANTQLAVTEARERVKTTQLQATLAGMTDGIMMVDAELQLLAWNNRFPDFTGVPADILRLGLPMEDMLRAQAEAGEFGPVDVAEEVERRMILLRQGGSIGTIERQRPNGQILEIRRNPLAGGGFVTLYSDITDRRHAEERARQAQTMAAIGRLTSGVAHDFNNLLSSITGNAEMLLGDRSTLPRESRRVAVILQAADRGAELVRQLLAFARKQMLTPSPTDLNAVLDGISELLRSTVGTTIQLETRFDPGLWRAMVDAVQIEHAVLNLAINARDAMPEGGMLTIATGNVTLPSADTAEDLPPGDYVIVAVTDTGTGMTEEVRQNAFEPFFTTKAPGRGSGLGLSQVYGLAQQSGGGVRIESRLSQGTTVRVLLPRARAEAPPKSAGTERQTITSDGTLLVAG